ncbi:MAG: Major Facilitator Superfamily arabinose transporter [Pseudonocardiales bacterium]|nr:Major Facilitator Superfamily arabinose transporter [Pseudonocardiales bacterium]
MTETRASETRAVLSDDDVRPQSRVKAALTPPDPLENDSAGVFSGALRLTSIGLLIVVTLVAFEAMAVSTAMPTAARELHGLAYYGWAFSGFIVANIVGLVASGIICDRQGPKLALGSGLAVFLGGLLTTGTATTMLQFVGGRVVQGFGAGVLLTAIYVVIGENYTDQQRPKIFAAMSSAWVVPSLSGPLLSGFLTENVGWRWVFLGLAPLVVVGALLMAPQLSKMSGERRPETAGGGAGRLARAVAVAAGVAVLVQAGQDPEPVWLVAAVIAVVALAVGLSGLVPSGTFAARRGVPATVALRGLLAGAMFGAEAFIPLALTVQHGYTATAAGLPLLGSAVAWSAGSWWQGRDAMNGHRPALIRAGFAFLMVALIGAALASVSSAPGWLIYLAWPFAGIGAGLGMSSIGVLMLAQTNDADRGRDSSALQLGDSVVSASTTGFGSILIAAALHGHLGYSAAFVILDLTMVGLAVLGFLAAARSRGLPT